MQLGEPCKVLVLSQGFSGASPQLPASSASQRPGAASPRLLVSVCQAISDLSGRAPSLSGSPGPHGPPASSSLAFIGRGQYPSPASLRGRLKTQPRIRLRLGSIPALGDGSHTPEHLLGDHGALAGKSWTPNSHLLRGPEDSPAQPSAVLSPSPAQARLHTAQALAQRPLESICLSTGSFSPWLSHSVQLGLGATASRKPPWCLSSCPGPGESSSKLHRLHLVNCRAWTPLFLSKQ